MIPCGSDADVDRAVTSARRAFVADGWSAAPPSARKRLLRSFAALIAARANTLDAMDACEMGKPISLQRANARAAASLVEFYAEATDKVTGDTFPTDPNTFVTHRFVPRGVVAAVVPWNFPTFNALLKIAPALAAGNSVVLKPSELSPRSAVRLAQLAIEAGFPPGVLNVVPGAGHIVGRRLGLHMDVDMLTFTGSTDVGKRMLRYSGESNMKVVAAECGGKSPQIVFDDGVDLDAAAETVATFLLANQGQICSVGSRLLVQRSIHDVLLEKVVTRLRRIVIGDALDRTTTFGPLVSQDQCTKVLGYIDAAPAEGARLVLGGRRVLQETGGYFVEPTVFTDVRPHSRLSQEEIFGPVLAVIPFTDETEAIRLANDTMYGLIAYAWTADLSRAMRLSKRIYSSLVISAAIPTGEGAGDGFSLEPTRQSGLGVEGGMPGLESYLRRQLVWINH